MKIFRFTYFVNSYIGILCENIWLSWHLGVRKIVVWGQGVREWKKVEKRWSRQSQTHKSQPTTQTKSRPKLYL